MDATDRLQEVRTALSQLRLPDEIAVRLANMLAALPSWADAPAQVAADPALASAVQLRVIDHGLVVEVQPSIAGQLIVNGGNVGQAVGVNLGTIHYTIQSALPEPPELFISYAQPDKGWVEGVLLDALHQVKMHWHRESIEAMDVSLFKLEHALRSIKHTLIIVSRAYPASLLDGLGKLLSQQAAGDSYAPSLMLLLLEPRSLPDPLAKLCVLDATIPAKQEQALSDLFARLALPLPPPQPSEPPDCPYPGMRPYTTEEAALFYGRHDEIEKLLRRLRVQRCLFIIGPSGSGKSSLINAGLLPKLLEPRSFPAGFWAIRRMRPGEDPWRSLEQTLEAQLDEPTQTIQTLLHRLQATRLLLVIDPFEELFTRAAPAEQERFLSLLQQIITSEAVTLLLSMRADFYPDLMTSRLWPLQLGQRLEITPLRSAALRAAIVEPAAKVGVYLEPALVEQLLAHAAEEPGVLPLLQDILFTLWPKLDRRHLALSAYETLGEPGRSGLAVAIANRADAVIADLAPDQQLIARRIFLRLIQFGEGRADTRRQQTAEQLSSVITDTAHFEETLNYLSNQRLLTITGESGDAQRRIDIAHEILIISWPQLQEWLQQRREAEQSRRRLELRASEWDQRGQRGGLLDPTELPEAERWLDKEAEELGASQALRDFVQASRVKIEAEAQAEEARRQQQLALERRARNRARIIAAIFGFLALIGLGQLSFQRYQQYRAKTAGETREVAGLVVAFERVEVTNARYRRCVAVGRCKTPVRHINEAYYRPEAEQLPVTGIDAIDAAAFCRWIGRRLPTLAEWEHAVQWSNGQAGPLRGTPHLGLEEAGPRPVDESLSVTADEIDDLIGNVWELTSTSITGTAEWDGRPETAPPRVFEVGGSYRQEPTAIGPTKVNIEVRSEHLGFRCIEE